jgi:hypothetical protein
LKPDSSSLTVQRAGSESKKAEKAKKNPPAKSTDAAEAKLFAVGRTVEKVPFVVRWIDPKSQKLSCTQTRKAFQV